MQEAIKEFQTFVKRYDLSNPDIMRKFHHTFRVVEYAKDIARSEGLSEDDVNLAMLCALLHDIARFRQWSIYKTYVDEKSYDHGDEAYKILKDKNYISKYTADPYEQRIILKAVKNHNKYKIEDGLSDRELFFTKLVRDADKIDIICTQNELSGVFVFLYRIDLLITNSFRGVHDEEAFYRHPMYVVMPAPFRHIGCRIGKPAESH